MLFNDFSELFALISLIFFKGGWVVLAVALLYMFYLLYMDHINIRWHGEQQWVFLKITAPRENEKSPLAFEQIFNHLHSIHSTRTWAETYIEGQFQIWFVWELVSIGGIIGNYVRILEKHRDTLEAAIYSQYPNAEITEADDYIEHLPKYDPDSSAFDMYAFSFILKNDDAYPIRSYLGFEHSSAETFIDPIDGLWEQLDKINEYEMYIVQYLFRPMDDEWKKAGYKLVQKLKGVPQKKARNIFIEFLGRLLGPIFDIFTRPGPVERPVFKPEPPPSLMLHLSEGEKQVIAAIERNLAKLGYQTKIRCLYVAPKEKYNPGPANTAMIGAFKSLGATDLNSLKPDTDRWTRVRYWAFEEWEKPIHELRLRFRKRKFMSMIRRRWFFHGPAPYVLNTEEMATILHFPRTEVVVPKVEKVEVTKVQPPPELPIAQ